MYMYIRMIKCGWESCDFSPNLEDILSHFAAVYSLNLIITACASVIIQDIACFFFNLLIFLSFCSFSQYN